MDTTQKLAKSYAVLNMALYLLFTSCAHSVKETGENNGVREIDIKKNISNTQKVNLSAIASNIEYCVLETDKKCLVAGKSIYCSKEYAVTLGGGDNMTNAACYVFERKSGNFVRKISSYGRGPGEYTEINTSFWDRDKEQICLLGNNQYLFYNLDGTLSHKVNRFNHFMMGFVSHEDLYVGYVPNRFGNSTVRVAFYDNTGAFIDSIPNYRFWERRKSSYGGSTDSWLYTFNYGLYYKDIYCDTLYQIKDFSLHPRYIFNTGRLAVPYEIQEGGRYDYDAIRSGEYDRYEKYMVIMKVLEDAGHLYFTIQYRNQRYPAIYDKTESNLKIMPPISVPPPIRGMQFPFYGFENDLDGGLPFWPQQMISDKEMMCVYLPEDLLTLDVSEVTDEKLKNVLSRINEESNPVIAIVTLKD